MKISRSAFLKNSLLASIALGVNKVSALNLPASLPEVNKENTEALVKDEKYWAEVRQTFCTSTDIVNLNNAALSPQPTSIQNAETRYNQYSNEGPSYFMWEKLGPKREALRTKLAKFAGCPREEIAFSRNATEALNTVIYGIELKSGDEVILSNLDYPFVINSWKQRAERSGIKLKYINLNFPENSEATIINKYSNAITSKTKLIHLTHIINWNGQILPVKELIEIAHKSGCKVLLDAAHSFAHLPHKISDLNADYYAASLHKWLCAPFGTGFLQIKKKHISETYPLHSAYDSKSSDIKKFEFIGSRSFARELAIDDAIDFHNTIGSELKYKRLSYLKNYWINQVNDLKGFKLFTPKTDSKNKGGSIAAFGIEGLNAQEISNFLMKKHKLHIGIVNLPNIEAARISPHIYTQLKELDLLAQGIQELYKSNQKHD